MKDAANPPPNFVALTEGAEARWDLGSGATSSTESLLDRASSLCASCGVQVAAAVVERNGKVYQRILCPDHPAAEQLLLSDSRLYHRLSAWNQRVFGSTSAGGPQAVEDDDQGKAPLLAIIDLTNRCNLGCPVCFAEAGGRDVYYLDLETVRRMLRMLVERRPLACRHIQFSGGEPTLHPQFLDILRMAREMGFDHIQVATNGSLFANLDFTRRCEDAGLHTLYLQFDGMSDDVYVALRGEKLLERKLRVVSNVTKTSLRLVLVPTIVTGLNVDQLGPIFRFALEHSRHITGISVQPMAAAGRVNVARGIPAPFNLADMAVEFGRQTGLTRFPDDWFPLNALTLLTRSIAKFRGVAQQNPACDSFCSVGTYFHVDDNNQPACLTSFFDLEQFLLAADAAQVRPDMGATRRRISGLAQLGALASHFDADRAPDGLTFRRLVRGLDGWEDKSVGRGRWWSTRGFNGMFLAGMHFMDCGNYDVRRVRRCIIKYVTIDGRLVSFCNYNAGERHRIAEESTRLSACHRAH